MPKRIKCRVLSKFGPYNSGDVVHFTPAEYTRYVKHRTPLIQSMEPVDEEAKARAEAKAAEEAEAKAKAEADAKAAEIAAAEEAAAAETVAKAAEEAEAKAKADAAADAGKDKAKTAKPKK